MSAGATLENELSRRAQMLGFTAPHIADASIAPDRERGFWQALARGHHGTMQWLERTAKRRAQPRQLWPAARRAIILGMNYGPAHDPLAILQRPDRGAISVYAQGEDYHDVMKGRLKELAGWLASAAGADVKVFVDTAPLLEKPLAERAGLGWQGKHSNLVSRRYGSWLFLGTILTTAELKTWQPETDHCGTCRRCLDICPTDAFPQPYKLDARRCISYLTIEHAGPIPHHLRPAIGNRIYGCDDCLAVCPWNRFAREAQEARLRAAEDKIEPELVELAALSDNAFRVRFRKSPIKRIGWARFQRNVMIALGNSGLSVAIPAAERHLGAQNPDLRGAAIWALSRLLTPPRVRELWHMWGRHERHPAVQREWSLAMPAPQAAHIEPEKYRH